MARDALVVVYSYHHKNTEKIAHAIAKILGARVETPQQITIEAVRQSDIVGFGSGIYDGKHHEAVLQLARALPQVSGKKAFIFSTCGVPAVAARNNELEKLMTTNHAALKGELQSKGYIIAGEFTCCGFNTNSFLKVFGGINKGRPNAEDLENAGEFARHLCA